MPVFNAQFWFWDIATHTQDSNVYASDRNIYVDPSDAGYQKWQAAYGPATSIGSEVEVWNFMKDLLPAWLFDGTTFSQPAEGQYTTTQLHAYQMLTRYNTEQSGITLTSGMPIMTDDRSQGKINGAWIAATGDSKFTTQWHAADGNFYPMDATAVISMSTQLQAFIDTCFNTSDTVAAGIDNGSITTLAQIDNAFGGIATRKK
jgi:hypothetical protein